MSYSPHGSLASNRAIRRTVASEPFTERSVGAASPSSEISGDWLDEPTRVAEGMELASVEEIAAMKLVAVMTRCAKKDFFDLAAIAGTGMEIKTMIEAGCRMFPGFERARDHLRRSMRYFDDADTDPDPILLTSTSWFDVKRLMQSLSRQV
ncbi:MAG TPA: nucleotidyl transferase AbiEii/AbiGii toxin family protein [Longimicrobium sp.]|nr:nucleotidyl transferase AbiEii/AbiGii toxin family protein [Longimicrobium sp.]